MGVAYYSPDSVECSLAGYLIQGFADGEFITIEKDSNDYEDVVGTMGDVGVSKVLDERRTVTIKLLQTSSSNDDLSTLRAAGRTSKNGSFAGAFSMRDASGTSILQGTAWIMKEPSQSFDRTITSREWQIRVVANRTHIGGGTLVG